MHLVTDAQRRARLGRRHGLGAVHRHESIAAATAAMTAWHATEPVSVHLALHARVAELTLDDVEDALYRERSLIKQLAMRRTLFAFPRSLLPAALGSVGVRVARTTRAGLLKMVASGSFTSDPERWLDDQCAAVVALLDDGVPRTGREVGAAIADLGRRVDVATGTKWASNVALAPQVLTYLGVAGRIARAENAAHWRISRPSWTSVRSWLGSQPEPLPAREGYAALVGSWLMTFGPGTESDLVWWLGSTKTAVRTALIDVGAEPVRLQGGATGWLHPDDTAGFDDDVDPWAALLPILDPTLMGYRERAFYLDPTDVPYLFDSVGNGGTTAWVDGRAIGCWVQDEEGAVRVLERTSLPASRQRLLTAEAERLTHLLDGQRISSPYFSAMMRGERIG